MLTSCVPSQYELEEQLCLFARDEVITWLHQSKRPTNHDANFRGFALTFSKDFVRRVETLACKREREEVSICLSYLVMTWRLTVNGMYRRRTCRTCRAGTSCRYTRR